MFKITTTLLSLVASSVFVVSATPEQRAVCGGHDSDCIKVIIHHDKSEPFNGNLQRLIIGLDFDVDTPETLFKKYKDKYSLGIHTGVFGAQPNQIDFTLPSNESSIVHNGRGGSVTSTLRSLGVAQGEVLILSWHPQHDPKQKAIYENPKEGGSAGISGDL